MRLIDADKAIKDADHLYNLYVMAMANADTQKEINHIFKRQELFKAVKAVIGHSPTVDPVKHGAWITDEDYVVRCSVCGKEAYYQNNSTWYDDFEDDDGYDGSGYLFFDYCHNCGAKMDVEDE